MFTLHNLILKILPISWGRMRYFSAFTLCLIDINSDTDSAAGRGTYLSCHVFFCLENSESQLTAFCYDFYQICWRIETGSSCAAFQPHTEYNVTKYGVITFFNILNISSWELWLLYTGESCTLLFGAALLSDLMILHIFVLGRLELGTPLVLLDYVNLMA